MAKEFSVSDLRAPQEESREIHPDEEARLTFKVLLSDEGIMESAADIYDRNRYFRHDPLCSLPWRVVYDYFTLYRELPGREWLEADIKRMYKDWASRYLTSPLDEILQLLRKSLVRKPRSADIKVVRDSLRTHLSGKAREMLDGSDDLLRDLPEVEALLNEDPFTRPKQVSIGTDLDEMISSMRRNPRITMDISFLDYILQGGMRKGETLGQVIPTGVGKTASAYQMGVSKALVKKHTLIMSFEQYYDEDIKERVIGLATGASRDTIRAVVSGHGEFSPDERSKFEANMPLINEYMHVVDRYADPEKTAASVKEVVKEGVEACCHMDGNPLDPKQLDTIILDWWGLLIARIKNQAGGGVSDSSKRDLALMAKNQLKTLSQDLGARLVVYQQVGGEAASKGHTGKASSHNAQEDRNFNNLFDYCMVATPLNPADQSFELLMDKSRGAMQGKLSMIMDGQYNQWRKNDLIADEDEDLVDTQADIKGFE